MAPSTATQHGQAAFKATTSQPAYELHVAHSLPRKIQTCGADPQHKAQSAHPSRCPGRFQTGRGRGRARGWTGQQQSWTSPRGRAAAQRPASRLRGGADGGRGGFEQAKVGWAASVQVRTQPVQCIARNEGATASPTAHAALVARLPSPSFHHRCCSIHGQCNFKTMRNNQPAAFQRSAATHRCGT